MDFVDELWIHAISLMHLINMGHWKGKQRVFETILYCKKMISSSKFIECFFYFHPCHDLFHRYIYSYDLSSSFVLSFQSCESKFQFVWVDGIVTMKMKIIANLSTNNLRAISIIIWFYNKCVVHHFNTPKLNIKYKILNIY